MSIYDMEWFELDDPLSLAVVVEIIVFFIFKPLITNLFETNWKKKNGDLPFPTPWPWRDWTMNMVCFFWAWVLSVWRLWGEQPGVIFLTGLLAGVMAAGGYEFVKNSLRLTGVDIAKFSYER